MAQYIAKIQGQRGQASRLGSKTNGMSVTMNGWNIGVVVEASYNKTTGKDEFVIYRTGGSNAPAKQGILTEIKEG
jgi:hypothetical protein